MSGAEAFVDPAFLDPTSKEFEAAMDVGNGEEAPASQAAVEAGKEVGADPGADGKTEGGESERPIGIASKNSDRIIPYSALESARAEAEASKARAAQMEQEMAQLQAQIAARDTRVSTEVDDGRRTDATVASGNELAVKIAALAEDFPEFGEVAKAMNAQLEQQNALLAQAHQVIRSDLEERARDAQATVQTAIDGNAYISTWMNEDPDAYARAYAIDQQLQKDPAWADKPLSDRFDAVVKATMAVYPNAKQPAPELLAATSGKDLTGNETVMLEKAKAALAGAERRDIPSLGQIPGAASVDEMQDGNLTAVQMAALIEGKSQEFIDKWLEIGT